MDIGVRTTMEGIDRRNRVRPNKAKGLPHPSHPQAVGMRAVEKLPTTTAKDATPILCVEDDPVSLALMVRILERRFSRVLVARDGAEGLEVFQRVRPAIVVTDIHMPAMNGIEMARAIKAEAPGTLLRCPK